MTAKQAHREWFAAIEEESEEGSSSGYFTSEDPTGANLFWEQPFKVVEKIPHARQITREMLREAWKKLGLNTDSITIWRLEQEIFGEEVDDV
jgi:hypothetical protein